MLSGAKFPKVFPGGIPEALLRTSRLPTGDFGDWRDFPGRTWGMDPSERLTPMYARRPEFWEGDKGPYWSSFYPHPHVYTLGMMGFGMDQVSPVLVRDLREDEESEYWAWWDSEHGRFEFVYQRKFLVDMCFPYGTKAEEERGKGRLLNVSVEALADSP